MRSTPEGILSVNSDCSVSVSGLPPGDPEQQPSRGTHLPAAAIARKVVAITKVDDTPGYIQARASGRRSAGSSADMCCPLGAQLSARLGHQTKVGLTVIAECRT